MFEPLDEAFTSDNWFCLTPLGLGLFGGEDNPEEDIYETPV